MTVMAPDTEELIRKVNTLTLDKNRLKQKLNQLISQGAGQKNSILAGSGLTLTQNNLNRQQRIDASIKSDLLSSSSWSQQQQAGVVQPASDRDLNLGTDISTGSETGNKLDESATTISSGSGVKPNLTGTTISSPSSGKEHRNKSNVIAGVECSTSCEEDLLYMNNLYKERLDDYEDKWNFIQSKCTALLSELESLQKQYTIMKRENSDWEEKWKKKCDDYDSVKSELQTVVLNYETQLGAMSEHLSMISQAR